MRHPCGVCVFTLQSQCTSYKEVCMVLLYRISYLDICMVLLCDVPAPSVRPPERERERERESEEVLFSG